MSHVFLSYSRSDRGLANRVKEDLLARGLDVWSDRRLGLGGSWLAEISLAIDGARAVLFLATPAALASKWVMREVVAAQALRKLVVPLLAEGSRFGDLPASLAGINGVDLADGYEASINSVVAAFTCVADPISTIEVLPATLPELLLLSADDALAEVIAEIAQPIGLVVTRCDPFSTDVLEVAARAHIAVIDGRLPFDCEFVAGYAAGRGGRVLCVIEAPDWRLPDGAEVRFCRPDAADMEREICVAAFLPVRAPS